jgi:hypothetical protein
MIAGTHHESGTSCDGVLTREWRVGEIGGVRQLYTLSHDRVCIIDVE